MNNNINVRLEDISKVIREIKGSSNEKEKEDKIKEFEGNLKQDAIMLNEYPNIRFEFVDMINKIINSVYTGNINHKDKKQLDAIVDKIFPDEEMRGGKTKKTKTKKTKKRTKRGGVDESDTHTPLTVSMLNTSDESAIDKTDTEESDINDQSFGDLSMISVDEQDGPNELDITNTTIDPLTLSMLNTSQNNTSQNNTDNESFGGKKRTKRGGVDKEEQKRMNNSLITAVSSGNTELVKKLLKDGADANAKDNDSEHRNTVLMEAIDCDTGIDLPWFQVEHKITEIVKMLLSSGADVNAKNDNGKTALQIAIKTDCPEKIQQLLKRHLERQRDRKNLEMVIRDKPVKRNIGRQRMPKDMGNKIGTFLGGKRKTKRATKTKTKTKKGGTKTRRDPKPSEKGNAYKASQILKKNTINKRNTNRQRMDELDNLFQGITLAPVSPP